MIIVIKNNANFTRENDLYRMPCTYFARKSISYFYVNKGDFTITIKIPKNVFYYDEPISYKIILDCKNLDLIVNKIDVSLLRSNRRNLATDNKKAIAKQRDLLIIKNIKLNGNLKEHTIQGVINFDMDLNKEKYFFPPLIYESIEKNE